MSDILYLLHNHSQEVNSSFTRATMQKGADEIERLRAELAAIREREARLAEKLAYALRQNDLDMLLTGDEIRDCRAALAEGAQG